MTMRTHAKGVTGGTFGFALLLAALFFFAPTQVGGSTSYVVTEGISMLPNLHGGDLAVVRTHSSYRVGESVLYDSPVLHRPVLHRIVAIRDGRYFFKGDNNSFVDPGAVSQSALIGELWFHVPRAGNWVSWLGAPLHVAVIVAAAAFLLLAGTRERRRRGRRRRGTLGLHAPSRPSAARHHTSGLDLSG
jgi:signal peptidase I